LSGSAYDVLPVEAEFGRIVEVLALADSDNLIGYPFIRNPRTIHHYPSSIIRHEEVRLCRRWVLSGSVCRSDVLLYVKFYQSEAFVPIQSFTSCLSAHQMSHTFNASNLLTLNNSKTKFLLIGLKQLCRFLITR